MKLKDTGGPQVILFHLFLPIPHQPRWLCINTTGGTLTPQSLPKAPQSCFLLKTSDGMRDAGTMGNAVFPGQQSCLFKSQKQSKHKLSLLWKWPYLYEFKEKTNKHHLGHTEIKSLCCFALLQVTSIFKIKLPRLQSFNFPLSLTTWPKISWWWDILILWHLILQKISAPDNISTFSEVINEQASH